MRRWKQRLIADALGVSASAVSHWFASARRCGPEALRSRPHPGAPPKLATAQKLLIADFLWHGPEAYDFRGEVWTCRRVTEVLKEEFGVTYHKGHVSRLLKDRGRTPQIPVTRALQRNEAEIEHWQCEVWPTLKARARRERRSLFFVEEAGCYLLPGLVRTYAPIGLTPLVREWATRDHLSIRGGLSLGGKVYTLVRQEPLTGRHTVLFLEHLLREIQSPLLLIWDRSPIHRRAAVTDFSAEVGERWLHVEPLPTDAPDLNPVEGAWQHLKHVELRNLACLDLEQLHAEFH
jgi:transposase